MQRLRGFRARQTPREEEAPAPQRAASTAETRQAADAFDSGVQVIYGASVQALPLVGLRVSDARPLVETILRVDPRSPAVVNGRQVTPEYVIVLGDVLEFVHHAGEKGRVIWISESN
jgi:hypothetical protein